MNRTILPKATNIEAKEFTDHDEAMTEIHLLMVLGEPFEVSVVPGSVVIYTEVPELTRRIGDGT